MRIFKYRVFHRWMKHEEISDYTLKNTVREIGKSRFINFSLINTNMVILILIPENRTTACGSDSIGA